MGNVVPTATCDIQIYLYNKVKVLQNLLLFFFIFEATDMFLYLSASLLQSFSEMELQLRLTVKLTGSNHTSLELRPPAHRDSGRGGALLSPSLNNCSVVVYDAYLLHRVARGDGLMC